VFIVIALSTVTFAESSQARPSVNESEKANGQGQSSSDTRPITVTVVSPSKTAEELKADAQDRENNAKVQGENLTVQKALAEFSRRLVWVGVAQVVIAVLGFWATVRYVGKQANAAVDALHMVERADVLMDAASPTDDGARLVFKNFGRSRASNVRCLVSIHQPGTPEGPPIDVPIIVLGPGQEQSAVNPTPRLTHSFMDWMHAQGKTLVLEGDIRYDDVFGRPHVTHVEAVLDPKSKSFRISHVKAD